MSKIHLKREPGEEIYWTYPGEFYQSKYEISLSGYGVLVEYINHEIARIKKDGQIIEVYISELS